MLRKTLAQLVTASWEGVQGIICIDTVDTAADLKSAKVFVSLIGSSGKEQAMIEFLESHRGEFQKVIADQDNLKFTPVLNFQLSHFSENLSSVDKIFRKLP